MDKFSVFSARLVDKSENFTSGHRACQGCAEALAVRHVMKALGRDTIVAMATGCMEIISSPLPLTSWKVPWIHNAFENPSAVISGVESGMKAMMRKGKLPYKKINYVAMGGDGATADIGMGQLSGALERGHDFLYVCYDNEAYMNTGIQRSSATPWGASTTTSPAGKTSIGQHTQKKNMAKIAVAHNVPYVATACSSYPFDLMDKVKRAFRDARRGIHQLPVRVPHGLEDPHRGRHQVRATRGGLLRVPLVRGHQRAVPLELQALQEGPHHRVHQRPGQVPASDGQGHRAHSGPGGQGLGQVTETVRRGRLIWRQECRKTRSM
jgi:hypothetical protein